MCVPCVVFLSRGSVGYRFSSASTPLAANPRPAFGFAEVAPSRAAPSPAPPLSPPLGIVSALALKLRLIRSRAL